MKKYLLFFILIGYSTLFAHNKYGFDKATFVNSRNDVSANGYYGINSNRLLIDEQLNKYNFNTFRGQLNFLTDTLLSSYPNNNLYGLERSFYLSKFDQNDNFVKAKKLGEADTLYSSSIQYENHNLYLILTFEGKLFLGNDTIISKGKSDICIVKYDDNLNLIKYLQIGNHFGESVSENSFKISNGHLFFAGNYNLGDSTNNIFDSYMLAIATDTLICDTNSNNSLSEYFICEMDTNLMPIQVKSMGGAYNNYCYGLDVLDGNVYIICSTSSYINNNIGGLNYNSNYTSNLNYIAKLDNSFNGKWVRGFYQTGFGTTNISNFKVSENNITFVGHTVLASGSGGNNGNYIFIDNYGNIGSNLGGSFSFIISLDTLGFHKWNYAAYDFPFSFLPNNVLSEKLYVTGDINNNGIIFNDTIQNICGTYDKFLAEINMHDGTKKFIATLCGNYNDKFDAVTQDINGKLYVVGNTNSDQITTTTNTITPLIGEYNVFYTSLDSFTYTPTGISNLENKNDISVFPNPTSNKLYVSIPYLKNNTELNIVDLTGKIVYTEIITTNQKHSISLPTLSKGMYVVKIKLDTSIYTEKLLIE